MISDSRKTELISPRAIVLLFNVARGYDNGIARVTDRSGDWVHSEGIRDTDTEEARMMCRHYVKMLYKTRSRAPESFYPVACT
jgi:hypothetical protein